MGAESLRRIMLGWPSGLVFAFGVLLASVASEVVKDRIHVLPGWPHALPSRQWSGYVDADGTGTRWTHYWFVESERDPQNDPVLVWYNGGPGSSAIYGLLTEVGPFLVSELSLANVSSKTDIPTLFYNRYGWQKVASLLVFDSPAPVGFSYCGHTPPPGPGKTGCPVWNDTSAGVENRNIMNTFFKDLFPEFARNPMYIAGESYAGIYIPEMVKAILDDPGVMNLKGMAIGNGCVGIDSHGGCGVDYAWIMVEYMQNHGTYDSALYREIISQCTVSALQDGTYTNMPGCTPLLNKMARQIGGYYEYALYDECFLAGDELGTGHAVPKSGGDYVCGSTHAYYIYLNNTKVREALHVPEGMYFLDADGSWHGYNMTERDLRPFIKSLATRSDGPRVLIYNGDNDVSVPYLGAMEWVKALGLPERAEWRPWTTDGANAMAGYVTRYEKHLDFLTVRGSGHMVPQMRPRQALEMISRWMDDAEWLPYTGPVYPPPAPHTLQRPHTAATLSAAGTEGLSRHGRRGKPT